jgi:hypothetical protein
MSEHVEYMRDRLQDHVFYPFALRMNADLRETSVFTTGIAL